jgi:hypothetical protein
MAINQHTAAFLGKACQQGVDFGSTLMIGRQQAAYTPRLLRTALRESGMCVGAEQATAIVEDGGGYCEPLFQRLGANVVDSLDASDYEHATFVHDLNRPPPEQLRGKYSAVIDGGTLEHVFNFPVALAGCLDCVALGGHYLAVTPMNNWAGHGFYQFSPELYFRVLGEENGFTIRCMLWRAQSPLARWYRVADPDSLRRRVERIGVGRVLLYVVARRTALRDVLADSPQQSDYVPLWQGRSPKAPIGRPAGADHTAARRVYERLPVVVRRTWQSARWGDSHTFLHGLYNSRTRGGAFEPIALRDLSFS